MVDKKPIVSIILPLYKVKKYILSAWNLSGIKHLLILRLFWLMTVFLTIAAKSAKSSLLKISGSKLFTSLTAVLRMRAIMV